MPARRVNYTPGRGPALKHFFDCMLHHTIKHQKGEFLAARDKTPRAHAPALFGDRAIAPVAPVARNPVGNAISHGDWRGWELLHSAFAYE